MTALRTLLVLIGLRRLRETPARSLRAAGAIMVAVGAMLSCQLVTAAIARGVSEGLEAFAGRTALRIDAGEAELPESLLDAIRAVPGVEAAVPLVESLAHVLDAQGEMLTVFGLDLDAESRVRRYASTTDAGEVVDDPLVFLSQPNSIILTRSWAARHGLGRESTLALQTPQGRRTFVVRGLLEPEGPALAYGGALALMDYQAAQLAFAKRDRLDAIDVVAAPGVDVDALAGRLQRVVGAGLRVESPGAFGAEAVVATRSVGVVFWLLSSLIAIMALFLLYNAVTMNVARRGEEIALMRALGVRRADTVRLLLVETVVVGVAGALAGVPFGLGLARLMLRPASTSVRTALLAPVDAAATLGPLGFGGVASAMLLGLGISLLAAWRPARQAARFVPTTAARRGAVAALREARVPSRWWGGALLLLGTALAALAAATSRSALGPAADLAFVVGFALLAPASVRLVLPALARLPRPFGAVGRIAALGVAATPQRSALTATPLMVAVALVVVVATMQRSFRVTFDEWMAGFGDTIQIASMSQDPSRAVLLSEEVAGAIAAIPGVGIVHRFRFLHTTYAGRRIGVEYNDYDPADPERGYVRFRRGDPATAFARLAAGDGVVVSENFAAHFGLGPGDVVELPGPAGVRALPIVATAANYNGDQGSIMMARRLFVDIFDDDRIMFVLVTPAPGTTDEQVRAAIAARLGDEHQLVIFTSRELRRDIAARIDRAFLPVTSLLVLAVVVGSLGIANALAVATEERRHEIGTLRALGARRRDVARLVVGEATVLGVLGVVLGLVLGGLLSYLWVAIHVRQILGWIIGYHFAPVGALVGVGAALVVAPVAAWWPARRAARQSPVEALASE